MEAKIVRKIDELGRLVLPMEMRRAVGIEEFTSVDVTYNTDHGSIIITKHSPCCNLCGGLEHLITMGKETFLCQSCVDKANQAAVK